MRLASAITAARGIQFFISDVPSCRRSDRSVVSFAFTGLHLGFALFRHRTTLDRFAGIDEERWDQVFVEDFHLIVTKDDGDIRLRCCPDIREPLNSGLAGVVASLPFFGPYLCFDIFAAPCGEQLVIGWPSASGCPFRIYREAACGKEKA